MKKWFCLCLLALTVLGAFAQMRPLSPMLHIDGVMKKDYEDVKRGDSCTLLRVVELKKVKDPTIDRVQAILVFGGVQKGIPLSMLTDYFEGVSLTKDGFWQLAQLEMIPYYEKKGYQDELRRDQKLEANRYLEELDRAKLLYDDAAVEDYLQCLMLDVFPERMSVLREVTPTVRVTRSSDPDLMMLGNNTLLVSTGLLALLDTEDEMMALLAREVSHLLFDDALVTINKNQARARRAAFWGSVVNGVVAATEEMLYEHNDWYRPGLLYATNNVVQALVNLNIVRRMGLDYSEDQEREADRRALRFMRHVGRSPEALASALHKIKNYYEREKNTDVLSQYGIYGSLAQRVEKLGSPVPQPEDRLFLKRTMTVVSYEAAQHDYNKDYQGARRLSMKNIDNSLASADDYLMVARSLMKLSATPESNDECLLYLDKADIVSKVDNVNITKMKILLMLRGNKQMDAVDLLKKYQQQLDVMFQQPHTAADAEWITAEHTWAENLLERLYRM